jgi:peptide deformylase
MALLPLVTYPDPLLKQISNPVEKIDSELQKFMDDMVDTMYVEDGIGLAAVQVGVLKRILVMDIEQREGEKNPIFIINPEIVSTSEEESSYGEGCLSFPGERVEIIRPAHVHIKYLDYYGNHQELKAEGLKATCIQHEMDHLNGITIIDHASKTKKILMAAKLTKLKRAAAKKKSEK